MNNWKLGQRLGLGFGILLLLLLVVATVAVVEFIPDNPLAVRRGLEAD
jgi:CHASE3 domain sensor protein